MQDSNQKLLVQDRTIGVLNLESVEVNRYGERDIDLLRPIIEPAATAIYNAQEFGTIRKELEHQLEERDNRIRSLKTLHESGPSLEQVRDPALLLPKLAAMINQRVNADVCSIWELDRNSGMLYMIASDGIDKKEWRFKRLTPNSVTGQTIDRKELQNIPNILEKTPPNFENPDMLEELRLESMLSVPLALEEVVKGAINIYSRRKEYFDDESRNLLTNFADYVSISLEQVRSSTQAVTLYQIGLHLSSSDNLEDVWSLIVSEASTSVGAQACSLFLSEDDELIKLKKTTGLKNKDQERNAVYKPGEGLTGWVYDKGKPLRIFNVRDSERLKQIDPELYWSDRYREDVDFEGHPEVPFLAVPIFIDGESSGVLRVTMKRYGVAFSESDQVTLVGVAAQIGAAIHRSKLDEQVHRLLDRTTRERDRRTSERDRKTSERRYLGDAIRTIGSELDVNEVLRKILQSAMTSTKASLASIRFYNEDDRTLQYAMVMPENRWDNIPEDKLVTSEASIGMQVVQTQTPCLCPDTSQNPYWNRCFPETKSCIVVPLTYRDDKIGVLCVDSRKENAFDNDDKELLSLMGVQAAVAIKNAGIVKELHEVDQAKDAYMLDVAHQLVSPLQGVLGHAENLLSGRYREDRYYDILQDLVESSKRCARMAKNFAYLPSDLSEGDDLNMRRQPVTNLLIAAARNFQLSFRVNIEGKDLIRDFFVIFFVIFAVLGRIY